MTLILASLLWPLLLTLLVLSPRWRRVLPWAMPVAVLPALGLALTGHFPGTVELSWLLTGVVLGLDGLRLTFLWLAVVLWLIAGVYGVAYLRGDARGHRFVLFWLLTLAGNLGLILSFDAVSFYTSFALMTFAGYGLVVHTRSQEAMVAGRVYLIMAVIGEAFILTGLFMAVHAAGFDSGLSGLPAAIGESERAGLISALLFLGFGVKAGVVLLHLWLPLAHPVAPTPASAVLSGVMIKAGLLGWLLMLPLGEVDLPALGAWVMMAGILGSLGAALVGVCQSSPKAVLAYSSVSQMGLMTVLVGAVLAQADLAVALLPVIAVYGLHHGLAKGALFLAVSAAQPAGAARGLWLLATVLPGLSLVGLPFTSGAAAKLSMKDAAPQSLSLPFAEVGAGLFFSAAAVATTVLVVRFLWQLAAQQTQAPPARLLSASAATAVAASLVLFWWLPVPATALSMVGSGSDGWGLVYPVVIGVTLMGALRLLGLRPPAIPPGDLVVPIRRLGGGWLHQAMAGLDRWGQHCVRQGQKAVSAGQRWWQARGRPEPIEVWLRRTAAWWFGLLLLGLLLLAW